MSDGVGRVARRPCRTRAGRDAARRSCHRAPCPPALCPCAPPTASQMWHWNEKKKIAKYYKELHAKERADEAAYAAELDAKIDELLGQ